MPTPFNLFDPKNLEANRRGELTDEQKKEIYAKLSVAESLTFMIIMGIFTIVGVCMLLSSLSLLILFLNNGSWVDGLGGLLMVAGYLLILFGWIKLWKHIIKSKRDKTVLSIRQGRGKLSFKNAGYVFEANDGSFALPFNNQMGLLPGTTYNIYSLAENNGILLSVEPLASEDKIAPAQEMGYATVIEKHAALNKILAEVNGFSFEDLKANHNGEITDQQLKKVKSPKMSAIFWGILSVLCFIFVFVVIFLRIDILRGLVDPNLKDLFVQGLLAVSLGIGAFGICVFNVYKLRDFSLAAPEQVQGVGKKHLQSGGESSDSYYYVVANKRFEVSRQAYTAFIDNLQYRVYYLPRTKALLSIELVDAPN